MEENKGKKSKKRKINLPLLIAVCVVGLILVIFAFSQIYKAVGDGGVRTEIALSDSAIKSIDTDMLIIRDEKIITSSGGNIVSAVKDGNRVGAGTTVAYSFANSDAASSVVRMNEISELLDYYNGLLAKTASVTGSTAVFDERISSELYQLAALSSSGMFASLNDAKKGIRDAITSRQTATGTELDLTDTITALQNEYNSLKGKAAGFAEIKSDISGYYISGTDGCENILDYNSVDSWTLEDVEKALSAEPKATSPSDVGRIVHGYYWYLVCVLPTDKINNLSEGSRKKISFSETAAEDITAEVYSVTADGKSGKSVVVFRCNKMNEEVASLRMEEARIILQQIDGYRIDNRAIRVNEKGEKGIYILSGMKAQFKKIYNIPYSTDEYSIVEIPPKFDKDDNAIDQSLYVRLYDEYIVEGKDLYEGKIIG